MLNFKEGRAQEHFEAQNSICKLFLIVIWNTCIIWFSGPVIFFIEIQRQIINSFIANVGSAYRSFRIYCRLIIKLTDYYVIN